MRTYKVELFSSFATLVLATGVAGAQSPLPKLPGLGPGKVKIEATERASGERLTKPAGILIYDFEAGDSKAASELTDGLVKRLRKAGQSVSRGIIGQQAPDNTLIVRGYFERIEEGNKLIRTGIGFGAGASAVQVHVELALGGTVVSRYEATSTSSKKPGAALSMGFGAAPAAAAAVAGAADQKQNVEGDVNRLAKQLSKEILKVMHELQH